MNIQSTLKNASKILNSFNIKNPLLDSEILLARAIKKDRQYIILNLNKKINQNSLNKFNYLVKRRTKGEPIAYLLKKKDFWRETFYVNENVLIPRPDTELIVEQVLKLFPSKSNLQILDIGTGSGCILLSILKERSNFYGTGIDISKKSINVCKYNTKLLNIKNRVRFYNSNVDNFIIGKYDLITSNPAYIKTQSLKYLEKDIYCFEPREALNGGIDGYSQIRKVIDKAAFLIKKNGKFFLEIGFNQKNKVCEMLKNRKFYINKVLKDYGNNYRCIISTKL